MKNIVLIGSGSIGSRHLQALTKINRDVSVTVVDDNKNSLVVAKKRFEELPTSDFIKSISFSKTLKSLHGSVDIAIISTLADVRKNVIESLLKQVDVKNLLLEKIVFQSVNDFQDILLLIEHKKIKAWVNFTRRIMPFYRKIKNYFSTNEKIYFHIDEGNWGLVQSSFHYLDLFHFITKENLLSVDSSNLDSVIQKSKRDGFIELTGVLKGKTGNGSEFSIVQRKGSDAPDVIQIFSDNTRLIISEMQKIAIHATRSTNWVWQEIPFKMELQSNLTQHIVQQILDTKNCDLTGLKETFILHKLLIGAFNDHLQQMTGVKLKNCPIT